MGYSIAEQSSVLIAEKQMNARMVFGDKLSLKTENNMSQYFFSVRDISGASKFYVDVECNERLMGVPIGGQVFLWTFENWCKWDASFEYFDGCFEILSCMRFHG